MPRAIPHVSSQVPWRIHIHMVVCHAVNGLRRQPHCVTRVFHLEGDHVCLRSLWARLGSGCRLHSAVPGMENVLFGNQLHVQHVKEVVDTLEGEGGGRT